MVGRSVHFLTSPSSAMINENPPCETYDSTSLNEAQRKTSRDPNA
jgi:hypothetical protein